MKTTVKRQSDEDPQPMRPPTFSHHALSTPKRPEPSSTLKKESTFKKESTVNTALLPGPDGPRVSPGSK
jgi:hypothetical protein